MSEVESIERAVAHLPPADLAEFRRWFAEFDATAGKLERLAEESLARYRSVEMFRS